MKLHELIIAFLKEHNLKLTERYLDEDRGSRPKLIRFVDGGHKYSIVFSNEEPILHFFKERLRQKKTTAIVHGGRSLQYKRHKIVVDLNDRTSFDQILNFL